MSSWLQLILSLKLPSLSQLSQGLTGFNNSYTINVAHEDDESIKRAGTPDTFMIMTAQIESSRIAGKNIAQVLSDLQWKWLSRFVSPLMLFLPVLINEWPRANAKNRLFNKLTQFYKYCAKVLKKPTTKWYWRPLGYFFQLLHRIHKRTPVISNRYVIRILGFIDEHLIQIALLLSLFSYSGLFFLGETVLAIAGGITLAIGILDRLKILPFFLMNFFKHWTPPITLVATIFVGSYFECLFVAVIMLYKYGDYIKNPLSHLFCKFSATRSLGLAFKEQERVVNKFDFHCQANQFKKSINALNDLPQEVIRNHVLDTKVLLPAKIKEDNLDTLLTLFDSINWNADDHRVIEYNKLSDWRFKQGLEKPTLNVQEDIALMRKNLVTFIHRLRKGHIHSVKSGTEDIVNRYTKAIIVILDSLAKESTDPLKKITLIDNLIRLGYETGEYCGITLLRCAESTYLNLMSENPKLNLHQRCNMILQMQRERYFERAYLEQKLHDGDIIVDTQVYSRAISYYAPRLGLPAQFAETDEMVFWPTFIEDIFSAFSSVERTFWEQTTPATLKKQLEGALNTPLLPICAVDEWHHNFIDRHVVGTPDEKEVLKRDLPYTVSFHGNVPVYTFKPAYLNAMLLDFGVNSLRPAPNFPENTFRPSVEHCEALHLPTPIIALPFIRVPPKPAAAVRIPTITPVLHATQIKLCQI